MSYKNLEPYVTRMIRVTLSSDQSITSTSATLVDFDTIAGDTGYKMSLVSGGNGRIRLKGGSYYHIVGITALDKDSASDVFSARWYNTSGTELGQSDGAFRSNITGVSGGNYYYESHFCQLVVNPSSDTDYDLKIDGETGTLKTFGTYLHIIEMSET